MTVNKTGQKIVFSTDAKRFTRAKATIKEKMWKQMHEEPKRQAKVINAILTGHYNYYGMAGNSKRLVSFYYEVERYWRRCLSRRSQNGKMSWNELNNLRIKYPLRQPFIKIPYGSLKQYVRLWNNSSLKSRMREIRTYGSVGGLPGNWADLPSSYYSSLANFL